MTTNLLEKLEALKATADFPSDPGTPPPTPAADRPGVVRPYGTPPPSVRGGSIKPNKFAGTCEKCRRTVNPGEGSFRRGDNGWITFHVGECPTVEPTIRVTATDRALPEEGVYVLEDGTIVKIKSNKAKTNRYANRWVKIGGERLTETGEYVNGEWDYAPELRSQCSEANRMTFEQAKEFGILYGQCVKCGRHLSDAESVERAIGPVCAKSFSVGGSL